MIENQPQVINNPVYLSALAASLSSSEEHEGQGVLEEENVRDLDTVARGRVSRDCGWYFSDERAAASGAESHQERARAAPTAAEDLERGATKPSMSSTVVICCTVFLQVSEKVQKNHQKYMLQEQLKVIKKELGLEKDDKDAISEKFRARLEVAQQSQFRVSTVVASSCVCDCSGNGGTQACAGRDR